MKTKNNNRKKMKLQQAIVDLKILKEAKKIGIFYDLGHWYNKEDVREAIQPLINQKITNIRLTPEHVGEGMLATGCPAGISIYTKDYRYLYGYNHEEYCIPNEYGELILCEPYYKGKNHCRRYRRVNIDTTTNLTKGITQRRLQMNNTARKIIEALYEHYEAATEDPVLKQRLFDAKFIFSMRVGAGIYDKEFMAAYQEAPGASKHHHNHRYGLIEHSFEMCMELCCIAYERKLNLTPREIAMISFAHDLCKVITYGINPDGTITYDETNGKKHGVGSLELATRYGIELSPLEKVCVLCHMSQWANENDYKAVKKDMEIIKAMFAYTREIVATQDADMAACKQYDFCMEIIEAAKKED